MPRTTLCGTLLHPQCQKINVKGAAYHGTGHSVAWRCTLSAEESRLRVRHTTIQDIRWHGAAPSAPKKKGMRVSIVRKSDVDGQLAGTVLSLVPKGPVACPSAAGHSRPQWRESGGCPLVAASVATLGHVRGRGPMDTSSAEQDEVDIGRDGADAVGGKEPRPEGPRLQA